MDRKGLPKFSIFYVPRDLCSYSPRVISCHGPFFPSSYIPHISSAVHMFPHRLLCFQGPIIPWSYVPHIYMTGNGDMTKAAMFPSSTYVLSLGHKFPGSYFFSPALDTVRYISRQCAYEHVGFVTRWSWKKCASIL